MSHCDQKGFDFIIEIETFLRFYEMKPSMIELTPEQCKAMVFPNGPALRLLNPDTQITYVLVPEELHVRMQTLLEIQEANEFPRGLSRHTMRVFEQDGWSNPLMDVYNDLDPRR